MNQENLLNHYDRLTSIVGAGSVVLPAEPSFADYVRDATYLQGQAALVLKPRAAAHVVEIVRELNALRKENPAQKNALTLTLRGGGSGLSGACVPNGGIVLDMTALNRVTDIDEENFILRAECGILLSEINAALHDSPLCYAVDPSSAALCTLGGSIATNAAGPSSLKYGTTRQNLSAVEFVDSSGEIARAGVVPVKTSLGFSLTDLLCGSEGRLGIITAADIRLRPRAEECVFLMASFASEAAAMAFVAAVRTANVAPKCCEIIDAYSASLVSFPLRLDEGGAVLIFEFDGLADDVNTALGRLQQLDTQLDWVSARDAASRADLWAKRKRISQEIKRRYPFRLGEDIAVPLAALAQAAAFARARAEAAGIKTAIWGHAGDGNLHVNYLLEKRDELALLDKLMLELAVETTRVGGAVSGEHGLGRLKRKFARAVLPQAYFRAQQNIKTAFDPECLFNPALEQD